MLSSKQILIFFDTSKADDINEEKGKFQFATKISFHGQLMKKFKLHRSNGWILCHVSWAKFTSIFSYFDGKQFLVLKLILILKEQLRQLSNLIKNIQMKEK